MKYIKHTKNFIKSWSVLFLHLSGFVSKSYSA